MKKTQKRKRFARSLGGDIVVLVILALTGAFMAIPLLYAVVSAFKPFNEIFLFPPRFFVRRPTTENFTGLWILATRMWVPFSRYAFNSVFVSLAATLAHILFASAAAYPLAKHKFPGQGKIFALIVATLLFTGEVTALPQYIIMTKLGWVDTYFALIFPFIGSTFGLFLMRQFIEQMVPTQVLEAARIDGANEYRIFWSIVMPNVKPAWLTLAIFCFQSVWSNTGLSVVYSEQLKPLPAMLQQIAASGIARMGEGMAVSLVLILPPILIFTLFQSQIVDTMSFAGLKE